MVDLIRVDQNNNVLGRIDKEKAHQLKRKLHRAFSIFIINRKKEILLQKRSKNKKLWPLFWSNACCSHPITKDIAKEAELRLKKELGFSAKLKYIYKFCYQAEYKNIGSENELCYVFIGKYNGEIRFNKKEVADYKWVDVGWLRKDIENFSDKYTPWFKLEFLELIKRKLITLRE